MARRKSTTGARARQGHEAGLGTAPSSPYLKRQLAFFDPLDDATMAQLEAQVDWLMQDVGIAFRDDPRALEVWRQAGAWIDGDRVRMEASQVRALCKTAPKQFTQIARNRARDVVIGGQNQVFAPIYGAPFVRDLQKGRRYCDLESLEKLIKLT